MVTEQDSFAEFAEGYVSPFLGITLVIAVGVVIGLLALFILHSITIWFSTDPVEAFHTARKFAGYSSSGWNSVRTLYNGGKKVAFYWVPGWNTFAKHMVEPGIYIGLDVISQVFAGHHNQGIIKDVDNDAGGVPFRGHYCGDVIRDPSNGAVTGFEPLTAQTTKYCSFKAAEMWAGEMGIHQSSDGANAISNGTTLLFSTAHARKLQEMFTEPSNEGESMFPAINLGPVLEAVQEIAGVVSMIQTTLYDIAAHIIFTVLSELAVLMWNMIQVLIRAVGAALMALVNSGALETILKTGLDLLMTLVVYVGIPMLIAILDLVVCIINFMQPGTWPTQIDCVEKTCFQESGNIGTLALEHTHCIAKVSTRLVLTAHPSSAGAEIFTTFSSVPIVAKAVVTAIEALVNPSTGRKYGEAAEGATDAPDIANDVSATAAAATCAACFSCKVERLHSLKPLACVELADLPSVVATMRAGTGSACNLAFGKHRS